MLISNRVLKTVAFACAAVVVLGGGVLLATSPSNSDLESEPTVVAASLPTATTVPAPEPITSAHVPILMYHHLKDLAPDADVDYQQLSVAPWDFQQQLDYLQDNGYTTITFAELLGAFEGRSTLPSHPVIISFDDGWDDIYHVAYPMLQERGMTATFFISTNWVENLEGVVSWPQIEEMSRGGMEFGSHSVTHPYLTTSEPDWLRLELEESKAALEESTGQTIIALAYPFGLYDDKVIAAVREAGYKAACTIEQYTTVYADQLLTMPRMWVYGWTALDDFEDILTNHG